MPGRPVKPGLTRGTGPGLTRCPAGPSGSASTVVDMAVDRESEILSEYEALLQAATLKLEQARREHESLTQVVSALRRRLGKDGQSLPTGVLPTYKGRVTLSSFLRALMADGQRRTLDQIAAIVERDERFRDQPPSRNTLSNRMHELANSGELIRIQRGVYELAGSSGNARGGSTEIVEAGLHAGDRGVTVLRGERDVDRGLGTDGADEVVDTKQHMARVG